MQGATPQVAVRSVCHIANSFHRKPWIAHEKLRRIEAMLEHRTEERLTYARFSLVTWENYGMCNHTHWKELGLHMHYVRSIRDFRLSEPRHRIPYCIEGTGANRETAEIYSPSISTWIRSSSPPCTAHLHLQPTPCEQGTRRRRRPRRAVIHAWLESVFGTCEYTLKATLTAIFLMTCALLHKRITAAAVCKFVKIACLDALVNYFF